MHPADKFLIVGSGVVFTLAALNYVINIVNNITIWTQLKNVKEDLRTLEKRVKRQEELVERIDQCVSLHIRSQLSGSATLMSGSATLMSGSATLMSGSATLMSPLSGRIWSTEPANNTIANATNATNDNTPVANDTNATNDNTPVANTTNDNPIPAEEVVADTHAIIRIQLLSNGTSTY
jgi:hypothetical protein